MTAVNFTVPRPKPIVPRIGRDGARPPFELPSATGCMACVIDMVCMLGCMKRCCCSFRRQTAGDVDTMTTTACKMDACLIRTLSVTLDATPDTASTPAPVFLRGLLEVPPVLPTHPLLRFSTAVYRHNPHVSIPSPLTR